jgi:hypothetical protein
VGRVRPALAASERATRRPVWEVVYLATCDVRSKPASGVALSAVRALREWNTEPHPPTVFDNLREGSEHQMISCSSRAEGPNPHRSEGRFFDSADGVLAGVAGGVGGKEVN